MNTNALTTATSPNYTIEQILQSTQPQSQPSGFRRILGGLLGGVGNMFAPGIGGLIGNAIGGGGAGGLMGQTMQMLQLQQQMAVEQENFEMISSVVKSRHDAAMAAIRNIN
jgi:hypothetical protein